MNSDDVAASQQAGASLYGTNEGLYMSPSCTGYGSASATCSFGDRTGQHITISTSDHGVAGRTFTASVGHSIPVAVLQVLGSGPAIPVSARMVSNWYWKNKTFSGAG